MNGILFSFKGVEIPDLKLFGIHVGSIAFVERTEGQGKLAAKGLQRKRLHAGEFKGSVGSFPDGFEVIDQCSTPLENHVANHAVILGAWSWIDHR